MRYQTIYFLLIAVASSWPLTLNAAAQSNSPTSQTLIEPSIQQDLGWVASTENRCGGYYLDQPFTYEKKLADKNLIQITSDQLLFAQHGTSIGEGKVTITRLGQQIIANKAYLYRDPVTGKLSSVDLLDNVTLREPNSLVIAKSGRFDLKTKGESLHDILYRTAIYNNVDHNKDHTVSYENQQKTRKITQLSAWGQADVFQQTQAHIYEFENATYSTCPPNSRAWQLKASRIELNKNTGRGTANHARIYVRGIPILYAPLLNFPLDSRRQTGFLTPTVGTSSKTGPYLGLPFYWNMAPNYDSTTTPAFLEKRGTQVSELFRYLTPLSFGSMAAAILPNDRAFQDFKESSEAKYQYSTSSFTQAELNRLERASDTRKSFTWQDKSRLNDHWFGGVDYNYVSDDYYLRDLNTNLNEVTQNQLLQQAQLNYEGENWKSLLRVQGYQTLHPIDQTTVDNQYTRLPQLVFNGDYPHSASGLDFSINNDLTHFDITNTPGSNTISPVGNRYNIQPGIARPFDWPYLYFHPRLQFAFTKYELNHVTSGTTTGPSRSLPIFDIHSGLYFDRNVAVFSTPYRQTLEPQIYYTYVPYKNQDDIPIFDTSVNTLTYDELFTYNRFSGLDRIGDANQISYGVTTRLIDDDSGYEKLRAGIGQIFYFENRRVTLCSSSNICSDYPGNPENTFNKSPLSGILQYHINPNWSLTGNSIWSVQDNQFNNQTINLQYAPGFQKIINLGYSYVRGGDLQLNEPLNSNATNLSQTDLSFAWPITTSWSTVGRWTQNWNRHHFQNLLYGLQYDSCCWAVRFVTGRAFTNLSPNNTYQYNTEFFIQLALKGLGSYGNADPSQLLNSSISGYQSNFGQDF